MDNTAPSLDGFIPPDYFYNSRSQSLATASVVVGVLSCFTLGFLGPGTVLGLVLGIVALVRIRREPDRFGGKGLAIAGIVTSALSGALLVLVVASLSYEIFFARGSSGEGGKGQWAFGRPRPGSPAANEEAAISRMRGIARSEQTYRNYVRLGKYAALDDLQRVGFIDHGDSKDGYKYAIELSDDSFEAVAVPERYGTTGKRSFYVSSDGLLHQADKNGAKADARDAILKR
jgi:hypothetical protein